ncbi:MAG: tetratricopeptide repeat protein [Planctomycetes bacterium]|nr:tetratricopeptide repeat protein [Planctomycetota bacterium]MCW8136705.1 tetratricopeptide repeat protein [Planctomycetota bacterium]
MSSAEVAYLFRHALLRDAAYELQMPADRAQMHALIVAIFESLFGGRPAAPATALTGAASFAPSPLDRESAELAQHAAQALATAPDNPDMQHALRVYLQRAATIAKASFRNDEAVQAWLKLAELPDGPGRGACLLQAAHVAQRSGRGEQAIEFAMRAAAEAAATGFSALEAYACHTVAGVHIELMRLEPVEAYAERALKLHRQNGDELGQCIVLRNLSHYHRISGQPERALEASRAALQLADKLGNRGERARALQSLATALVDAGQITEATNAIQEACEIVTALGLVGETATYRGNLGLLLRFGNNLARAEELMRESVQMACSTGDERSIAWNQFNLATLLKDTRRRTEAMHLYEQTLGLAREVGDARLEGMLLNAIAIEQADVAAFERALALHRRVGNRSSEGVALGNMAGLLARGGRAKDAEEAYLAALAIHDETRNLRFRGVHGCEYATFLLRQGRTAEAERIWVEGMAILRKSGDQGMVEIKITNMRKDCEDAGVPPFEA